MGEGGGEQKLTLLVERKRVYCDTGGGCRERERNRVRMRGGGRVDLLGFNGKKRAGALFLKV